MLPSNNIARKKFLRTFCTGEVARLMRRLHYHLLQLRRRAPIGFYWFTQESLCLL